MTTSEKIAYIRNSYGLMLKQSSHEFLYGAYLYDQGLNEAWGLDGSISWQDQKEIAKEIEAVYSVMVDKIKGSVNLN